MRFFLGLFLIFISVDCRAETVTSPDSGYEFVNDGSDISEFVKLCSNACLRFSKTSDSDKVLQKYFQKNCYAAKRDEEELGTIAGKIKFTGKSINLAWGKCLPGAVGKAGVGAWEFLKGLPSLIAYAWSSEGSAPKGQSNITKKIEWYKSCAKSDNCKVAVARQLHHYREMKSNGEYQVTDEVVLKNIKRDYGNDFNGLLTQAQHQFTSTQSECSTELGRIRGDVGRDGEDWGYEKHKKVFESLYKKMPFCPAALNLYPPKMEVEKAEPVDSRSEFEKLSFAQKLGVGRACFFDKFDLILAGACSEGMQYLVPLPLVGPQTRHSVGLIRTSMINGAKEVKAATSTTRNVEAISTDVKSRSESSAVFIRKYVDRIFATPEQNAKFIGLAEASNLPTANRARTRFFDIENSVMKKLNDKTGDKNLVTALTNYHKELVEVQLRSLKEKYPGVKFEMYSDFKSMKIAIQSSTDISPDLHKKLLADLSDLYADTNQKFATKMKELGVEVTEAGDPEKWFRAGFGASADETSLASRNARKLNEPQIVDATSTQFTSDVKSMLDDVERSRKELVSSNNFKPLLERDSGGAMIPRTDVFDLVRKADTVEGLAESIRKRYGLNNFTNADAKQLYEYTEKVNDFSPAIYIGKRENVNLDSAVFGGLSADFLGLGSANLKSTAAGLANRKDTGSAIIAVRQKEQAVTQVFLTRKEQFKKIAGSGVTCSGDDCVKIAGAAMADRDKAAIMNQLAANKNTQSVRIAFIGQGVKQEHRMRLATDGELIEKALRKNLEGKFDFAKSQKIVFGLDMKTTQLNEGTVNLIIGKPSTLRLSTSEQKKLHDAFEKAIADYNKAASQYVPGSTQARVLRLRLVPSPTIVTSDDQD